MKKFAIHTLGCKTNQLESATINDILIENGYSKVLFSEVSDFYIINTCSVTAKSDSESMYYIRKARKTNPEAKIIVTGCYAQLKPEEIEADIIIGNAQKLDILEYIKSNMSCVSDIMQESDFKDKKTFSTEDKTRANIKIQDGCNNRCSYCIIPYARGKSRSNSIKNIIEQVNIYTQKGFKEIVVTGIHIGQWGLDFSPKKHLIELLREFEKVKTLQRYRLGSLDPNELDDEMIEFLANSKKFAHHLHISLQSADNDVLKNMNRRYLVEDVKKIMAKLKDKMPNCSLGCDVIVGFPSETDEQFDNVFENLKEMPFSYMHIFPYSIRQGTSAAGMVQVDEKTKKIRANRLRELSKFKKQIFLESLIGQNIEVLIEKRRDKFGKLKGVSSNYIQVVLDGSDELKNQIIQVKITSVGDDMVFVSSIK